MLDNQAPDHSRHFGGPIQLIGQRRKLTISIPLANSIGGEINEFIHYTPELGITPAHSQPVVPQVVSSSLDTLLFSFFN